MKESGQPLISDYIMRVYTTHTYRQSPAGFMAREVNKIVQYERYQQQTG